MANNNISIKSISDLLEYKFFIPSYQRGYRWTKQQVEDLLNDINEFSPEEIADSDDKTWYCLQPIVVKKQGEKWEVIDGQQRLTTAYLILHHLRKKTFGLEYETRERSAKYLQDELDGKINNENIDFHFISSAYKTICDWFKSKRKERKGQEFDVNTFELKFNSSTKVIWYETSENEDSINIFTRINSGKIPLTNAELIKALFLNSSNFSNADTEKLRLKQLEIAPKWDRIECALQDDSFWYLINKKENNLSTRIEFVFDLIAVIDLMAVKKGKKEKHDKYYTFHHFNDKFKDKTYDEVFNNWEEIEKYYQTLEEWYKDRELYHKIGYLITIGISINDIILKGKEKNRTKAEFRSWLEEKIKIKENINELEYGKDNDQLTKILLLHNIITTLNSEDIPFPFDKYKDKKKTGGWSLEHVHAQNSEGISDGELESDFIENIAILSQKHNKNLSSVLFDVKRERIIELEKEGEFIPLATKKVFQKDYKGCNKKQLNKWGKEDRKAYLKTLKKL